MKDERKELYESQLSQLNADNTMVAGFEQWKHNKVNRYVKKGSSGIKLFKSRAIPSGDRTGFDVNDTEYRFKYKGEDKRPVQWGINDETFEAYVGTLTDDDNLEEAFAEHINSLIEEHTQYVTGIDKEICRAEYYLHDIKENEYNIRSGL